MRKSELTARDRWSTWQGSLMLLSVVACAAVFVADLPLATRLTTLVVSLVTGAIVLFKVASVVASYSKTALIRIGPDEVRAMSDADTPIYTILCPLYDEPAMVGQLLTALAELDYPRDRLDVILLVEARDQETRRAVEAHSELLGYLSGRMIVVPDGKGPRTKPRACNVGLELARGELLTIYDAEDWPECDQLKKAVLAFRRARGDVACLQCKLNYHNYDTNLLTRLFTLEYTAWYDIFLPGLRALGAVIPLGGTSNHFRTNVLRDLGGWDAYNVTEDCDLGVRLARRGLLTEVLDSTTWEEACADYGDWLKQRSKWTKGYIQTIVVHTRKPLQTLRELGAYRCFTAVLTIFGAVFGAAALLPSLVLGAAALWQGWHDPLWRPDPWTIGIAVSLVSFFPYWMLVHVLAAQQRRRLCLIPYALMLPGYWLFASVAALRGTMQFFTKPFEWEKTPHLGATAAPTPDAAAEAAPSAALSSVALDTTAAPARAAASASVRARQTLLRRELPYAKAPVALGLALALLILPSALVRPQPLTSREFSRAENASWFGRADVEVQARLLDAGPTPDLPQMVGLTRLFVVVDDGEWYEHEIESVVQDGDRLTLGVSLSEGWRPRADGLAWGPQFLRHVRKFGLRQLLPTGVSLPELEIMGRELSGESEPLPLDLQITTPFPAQAETFAVVEARFETGTEWKNPFDAEEVAWTAVIRTPSGGELRVPAFYTRDYDRHIQGGKEVLLPTSDFYWAVRFAAREAGTHRWYIEGRERGKDLGRSSPHELEISRSSRPGYVRLDAKSGRFAFESGAPYYPIGLNIGAPQDGHPDLYDFEVPSNDEGATVMESYLARMSQAGMTLGRMWLAPWFCGLEWRSDVIGYHGMGQYNLQNAWRMDRLLELAQRLGVHIELLLYPHGPYQPDYLEPWGSMLDSQWPENPYNAARGGPVTEPGGFLKNEAARAGTRNYLRYVAARFGAYPSLQSWDLWNEVDTVTMDVDVLTSWHREMAPVLRANDSGQHLISTGFRTLGYEPVWSLPDIDFVQSEAYHHPDEGGLIARFEQRLDALATHRKPVVMAEFGGAWWGGSMNHLAQNIHDGLWSAWVLGLPSAPMPWWWNLVLEKGLGSYHQVFSKYVQGEDLRQGRLRSHSPYVDRAGLRARSLQSEDRAYVWIYNPDVTELVEPEPARVLYVTGRGPKPDYDPPVAPLSSRYLSGHPDLFPEIGPSTLELSELSDGTYRVEFWDTWAASPVQLAELRVADGVGRLALPALRRDIALKVKRER